MLTAEETIMACFQWHKNFGEEMQTLKNNLSWSTAEGGLEMLLDNSYFDNVLWPEH